MKFSVEYIDIIDVKHLCSLWYNGKAAEIEYNGYKFPIYAAGGVHIDYHHLDDKGVHQEEKIKELDGRSFYLRVEKNYPMLSNDWNIFSLMGVAECDYEDEFIFMHHGNYWFCPHIILPDGKEYSIDMALDSALITNAVYELATSIPLLIEETKTSNTDLKF